METALQLACISHLWLMLGRGVKLASGVDVPVFLRPPVSLAVKDLPALTGSETTSLEAKLVSASVKMLLTSALPLLLTINLTAAYTCTYKRKIELRYTGIEIHSVPLYTTGHTT